MTSKEEEIKNNNLSSEKEEKVVEKAKTVVEILVKQGKKLKIIR